MARYISSKYATHKIDNIFNRSEDLADENNVIEGGLCTWIIPTNTAAHNLDVLRYDPTRASEYLQENGKPIIIVKCIGDASVFNVTLRCDNGAGGMTTLYTFAANYAPANAPRYVVLRVSATAGADGHPLWEIA
jgi:hypothetical protein